MFFGLNPTQTHRPRTNRPLARRHRTALLIESLETRTLLSANIEVQGPLRQNIDYASTSPLLTNFTDFGNTDVNNTTLTRSYNILNAGDATLNITGNITVAGADASDFTVTQPSSTSLTTATPLSSFGISFTPSAPGLRTATVTIPSDDPIHPNFTFDIQGTALNTTTLAGGTEYAVTTPGSGRAAVTGDVLEINYNGYLLNGTNFAGSTGPNRGPLMFQLGALLATEPPGWNIALAGMQVGETRTLIMPPSQAFGNSGLSPTIPGGSTLIYNITVTDIANAADSPPDLKPLIGITGQGAGAPTPVLIANNQTATSTTDSTDFGSISINKLAPVTNTFTVTNAGFGELTPNHQPVITGTGFSVGPLTNTNTFLVTFTPPAALGTYTGTLTLTSNDPITPTYTFNVTGTVAEHPPTLTTISNLTAVENAPFTINYSDLLSASNAADPDNDPILFKFPTLLAGSLTKNGVAVTSSTTFGPGESLVWTPPNNFIGLSTAFDVLAFDGTSSSTPGVAVKIQVSAPTPPTLTSVTTIPGSFTNNPITISYDTLKTYSNLSNTQNLPITFFFPQVTTGTLTKNGVAVTGSTALTSGQSIVWTPAPGATGTLNAFTVYAFNGFQTSGTPVQVSVSVINAVAVDPIAAQSIPTDKTLIVPITSTAVSGSVLTYSATSSNPAITPTIFTGNTFIDINVAGLGDMVLELFNNLAPNNVARIIGLINSGFYNGLSFHRIVSNFVAQGGDPTSANGATATGSGGSGANNATVPHDDEITADSLFSGNGQLALANSGTDTGDTQFFITDGPQRFLDFNFTIFGQLVRGFDVFNNIMADGSSGGTPSTPVVMTSVSVIADSTDAVMLLQDTGAAGTAANITVTAKDTTGHTSNTSFTATAVADSTDDPPFLGPIANPTGLPNVPVTLTIPVIQVNPGAVTYGAGVTNSANVSVAVNQTTGLLTITPGAGFTGVATIIVGVSRTGATSRGSNQPKTDSNGDVDDTPLYDTQILTYSVPALLVYGPGNTRIFSTQSTALDFGAQITNDTPPTMAFTLTNDSLTTVTLGALTLPSGFAVVGTAPTSIAAGKSATLTLELTTTTVGVKSGNVTFSVNDPTLAGSTFSFPVKGVVGTNFVTNLYLQILGRAADTAGLAYWDNLISTHAKTPAQITAGFVDSTEYRTNRIQALYTGILGRRADSSGLTYWLNFFAGGGTVETMESGFYGSQEYLTAHGGTNASVVRAFYSAILLRSADSAGVTYWSNAIVGGESRTKVALAMITTTEGRTNEVQNLYNKYLHRSADSSGLTYWIGQLANGSNENNLIISFLSSPEYFAQAPIA